MDYFNSGARPRRCTTHVGEHSRPHLRANMSAETEGFSANGWTRGLRNAGFAQLCDASLRSNLLRHDRSRVVFPASYDSCHSLKRFSSSVTLSAHQSSSMIALFGLVKSGRSRWVSGFRSVTAAVLLGE
jgi:hypothetical protein